MPAVNLKALDLIFITHLHSDHVAGAGPLLHTAWTAGLTKPVTLFAARHRPLRRRFCQAMDFDIEIRIVDEGRPDIREHWFRSSNSAKARFLRNAASRFRRCASIIRRSPTVSRCVSSMGKNVVFSADTAFFPPLASFAKDAIPRP